MVDLKIINNLSYQTFPLTNDMTKVDKNTLERIGIDRQFDNNKNVVNYEYIDNNRIISQLKNWFDTKYTKNEQKYRRLHTLGLKCDDGSEPIEKLKELYREAEEKRKEIQRLEQGGDENGTLYDNTL